MQDLWLPVAGRHAHLHHLLAWRHLHLQNLLWWELRLRGRSHRRLHHSLPNILLLHNGLPIGHHGPLLQLLLRLLCQLLSKRLT